VNGEGSERIQRSKNAKMSRSDSASQIPASRSVFSQERNPLSSGWNAIPCLAA